MLKALPLISVFFLCTPVQGQNAYELGDVYPAVHINPPSMDVDSYEKRDPNNANGFPGARGPRDCAEILDEDDGSDGNDPSGRYTIFPTQCGMCRYLVYCEMDYQGGGWTVVFRRGSGSIDFFRDWYFYKFGFGNIFDEFYLGNERIHQITAQKPYELRICLTDVGGVETFAGYSHFQLLNESTGFAISVHGYYGDAGDYLTPLNGTKFSTFDHDNDGAPQNCAKYFHSAWWYHTYGANCGSQSNLFGYYFLGRKELPSFAGPGLSWKPVPGPGGPAVKSVVWKLRPLGYLGGSAQGAERPRARPPNPIVSPFGRHGIPAGQVFRDQPIRDNTDTGKAAWRQRHSEV